MYNTLYTCIHYIIFTSYTYYTCDTLHVIGSTNTGNDVDFRREDQMPKPEKPVTDHTDENILEVARKYKARYVLYITLYMYVYYIAH